MHLVANRSSSRLNTVDAMLVASQPSHGVQENVLGSTSLELESALSDNETVLSRQASIETHMHLSLSKRALSELDAEIALIQDTLREPLLRRQREYSRLQSYRAALSPLRTVPNEILSIIFTYSVTGPIEVPGYLDGEPWNLSHVCSRWRQVALGEQDLWKSVLVNFDGHLFQQWRGSRYGLMMEAVLSRSQSRMLSFHLLVLNGGPDPQQSEGFVKQIIPHAARLHELSIWDGDHDGRSMIPNTLRFLGDITFMNLQKLLVDVPIHDIPAQFDRSQLRTLELDNMQQQLDYHRLNNFMHGCMTLTRMILRLPFPSMPLLGNSINLSNLTSLVLYVYSYFAHGNFICNFFEVLKLPNLTQLVMCHVGGRYDWVSWESPLVSLIARSSLLQRVYIQIAIPDDQLVGLITGLPNLVELILPYGRIIPSDTLRSMGRGNIVPKLNRLMVEATESLESYLDMLEGRISPTSAAEVIFDVVLVFDTGDDDWEQNLDLEVEHYPRIVDLLERGLNISLVHWSQVDVDSFAFPYQRAQSDVSRG
ncbi:hypothetical protein Hypma_003901 [Hypsizygus marmoreus]|uniref:F-box domain-containing protein n=1 Tax=Hypsizygus marmoreus TaxID=39966 RepID=A0A369JYY4_HYPMA|nr:hypothetical protein Hypma_003901 [Hypsizygus marmoreus]